MENPPKGRCTIVFRGGQNIVLRCRSVETTRHPVTNEFTGLSIDGMDGMKFLYIRLSDVSGIFWHEEE